MREADVRGSASTVAEVKDDSVAQPPNHAVPAVRIQNLTKVYDDLLAVDRLTIDVFDGEFFSLLGPSGCGKTTTLKCIGGFEQPTDGRIAIHGSPVEGLPPFRRNVNTVFQNYALFPHKNVRENVAFGLRMRKVSKRESHRAADEMLERMHLSQYGSRRIHQLSGGEQQRVALARALINRPAVLLLDEPLGALDFKLRKAMQAELKSIQRDSGISFVYVTHDQEEALSMSDRLAVMRNGAVLQIASPSAIYQTPSSRFVADFIGESSFLAGRVRSSVSTHAEVDVEGVGTLRCPPRGLTVGEVVTLAVRPENVTVMAAGAGLASGDNSAAGRVDAALYAGGDTSYRVRLQSGVMIRARMRNAPGRPPIEFGIGAEVTVSFPIASTIPIPEEDEPENEEGSSGR